MWSFQMFANEMDDYDAAWSIVWDWLARQLTAKLLEEKEKQN